VRNFPRVLLFQKRFHEGLASGRITLTFRRWQSPRVRPGWRYRCHPIGVLQVDAIERVRVADVSARDAVRSGFASRAELLDYLRAGPAGDVNDDTELFRVELHHGGDGDRVEVALHSELTPEDVKAIGAKLLRMDAKQAWTAKTLAIIQRHPRTAASQLAKELGRDTAPFKVDVRKLKKLGLTQSFEVGYEISPRGAAYLAAVRRARK
jgi:hypothetical protein